jgi:hypothetical protein
MPEWLTRPIAETIKMKQPSKQIQIDLSAARVWAKAFEQNTTLLHLDLSHNQLDA